MVRKTSVTIRSLLLPLLLLSSSLLTITNGQGDVAANNGTATGEVTEGLDEEVAPEQDPTDQSSSGTSEPTTMQDEDADADGEQQQQEEQDDDDDDEEIHPWFYCNWSSPEQPCALGYFCTLDNEGELQGSSCEVCPSSIDEDGCENVAQINGMTPEGVDQCNKFCSFGKQDGFCSDDVLCEPRNYYCDYSNEVENSGTCQACGTEKTECLADELSVRGQEDCLMSCDLNCYPIDWTTVIVDGIEYQNRPMIGAPGLSATGPLVDCTNLIYEDETYCDGVENAICLLEDTSRDIHTHDMVLKCQESGGIGFIMFAHYPGHNTIHDPANLFLSFKEVNIPAATISSYNGTYIRENLIGANAIVTIDNIGDYCWKQKSCNKDIPCIGDEDGDYCAFDWGDHGGWCWNCPVDDAGNLDPFGCYFNKDDGGYVFSQERVEACASVCGATLEFDSSCKFCPTDISAFEFGIDDPDDKCYFCPDNDVLYPERYFPIFGNETKCWQVQNFFTRIDIPKDSTNCQLAQSMNYICGCGGTGYGGAQTETKQKVLAWLPRVSALLSLLGSAFIVYDCLRGPEKRQALFYQLMAVLSVFDILGSWGYIFTTFPMPEDDYIYGSNGNEKSCIAQGFFIQLGTISCYTNVSLAVYFFFVIRQGWTEEKMKKIRVLLFGCPILVGLAFAFAGIPFFDNMILWCNNAASWWPDIPVAIAIFFATVVMGLVCYDVYNKERNSDRWKREGEKAYRKQSLSTRVFWQSFWYIVAFYVTWVPYLALQYTWASGSAYTNYGFILFAGMMVPLQGAWNCFVYIRPRYLKGIKKRVSASTLHLKAGLSHPVKLLAGSNESSSNRDPNTGDASSSRLVNMNPNRHSSDEMLNDPTPPEMSASNTNHDLTSAHIIDDSTPPEESALVDSGRTGTTAESPPEESLSSSGQEETIDPVMPDMDDTAKEEGNVGV